VKIKDIGDLKVHCEISKLTMPNPMIRTPIAASAGCHVEGVALPKCDIKSSLDLFAGCEARFCHQCPAPKPDKLKSFADFVRWKVREEFTPLSPTTEINHKEWLESRPYTEKEKQGKWDAWISASERLTGSPSLRQMDFTMFMKDETYTDYKFGRAINGPSDVAKVAFGPFIAPVEALLFARPEFIKKIAVNERPAYIKNRFGNLVGGHFLTSDYSYFEASFTKEMKEAAEFQFLEYMWSELPQGPSITRAYKNWSSNGTTTRNKNFSVMLDAVRMSGESTTSLGNGFTNWMVAEYFAFIGGSQLVGVYEGDDALLWFSKNPPSTQDYADLGFDIKLESHADLSTTSFCGQVFDFDDEAVLTDPAYVLAGFGWIPQRYLTARKSVKLSLIRAKAWSYGYQYQATPIISALARAYLRLTKSYDERKALEHLDMYKRMELAKAFELGRPELDKPVGDGTRALMAKLYGVDIPTQLKYEAYFDNLSEIEPIPDWMNFPAPWRHYSTNYVRTVDPVNMDIPCETWPVVCPVVTPLCPVMRNPAWQSYADQRFILRK